MTEENGSAKNDQHLAFIILIGTVGGHTNAVMPALIGTLIKTATYEVARVGIIASLELSGLTLSIVALSWFVTNVSARWITLWGSILLLTINLASIFTTHFWLICLLRCFSGASAGLLLGTASNRIGVSTSPQRIFGILYLCNSILTFSAFQIWHSLENFQGSRSPFLWLAIISAVGVFASFQLIDDKAHRGKTRALVNPPTHVPIFWCAVSLLCIFLLYFCINCLWSHIVLLAENRGIDPDRIHRVLSYVILSQIIAMGLAAWLGSRLGTRAPLFLGSVLLYAAVLTIIHNHSFHVFFASVFTFIFFWSFITPFLMGSLTLMDPTGRLTTLSIAALYGGLAAAPAVVGALLKFSNGEFKTVFWLPIILFPLSILSLAFSLKHSRAMLPVTV